MTHKAIRIAAAAALLAASAGLAAAQDKKVTIGVSIPAADHGWTAGVIFHLWERLPFHNAVWHSFVVVASACHFAAIVDAVGLTGAA